MGFFRKRNIFNKDAFTDALHKKKKTFITINKAEKDGSQSKAFFDTNKQMVTILVTLNK
jgi:hypothetical protein